MITMTSDSLKSMSTSEGGFYALYSFNGTSLSLHMSTLDMNQEAQLRLFLSRRLSKGALYSNEGSVSPMEFSMSHGAKQPAACYYILLPGESTTGDVSFVACLLATANGLLENFRSELGDFCIKLMSSHDSLDAEFLPNMEMSLSKWYYLCIEYISRVVKLLGSEIAVLLHMALCNVKLVVHADDPQVAADIERFYRACQIMDVLHHDKEQTELELHFKNGSFSFDEECNRYSQNWTEALTKEVVSDPGKLKKTLDNFKLQVIGDMNCFKRLVTEAETDHYALYRAYMYLKQCGNADVLFHHAKLEKDMDHQVVAVLEEFIQEHVP